MLSFFLISSSCSVCFLYPGNEFLPSMEQLLVPHVASASPLPPSGRLADCDALIEPKGKMITSAVVVHQKEHYVVSHLFLKAFCFFLLVVLLFARKCHE